MATRTSVPGADEFVPDTADLGSLSEAARSCRGCDLYAAATQTVFGAGPPHAPLVLVGEQPGDVEDRDGAPFVGPAGGVLDRALREAGIARGDAYVTNAVKHFSFTQRGKRRIHETPHARHISACRPWLAAELHAIRPELVVCLGAVAVRSVLGPEVRVLRDRGAVLERDSVLGPGRFLVTIHPSAVLRASPEDRERTYDGFLADLRVVAEAMKTSH